MIPPTSWSFLIGGLGLSGCKKSGKAVKISTTWGKWYLGSVVEPTHLKNIRQNGHLPQIGMNIKNIQKQPPRYENSKVIMDHPSLLNGLNPFSWGLQDIPPPHCRACCATTPHQLQDGVPSCCKHTDFSLHFIGVISPPAPGIPHLF